MHRTADIRLPVACSLPGRLTGPVPLCRAAFAAPGRRSGLRPSPKHAKVECRTL